jgi:hypothetical protein
MQHLTLRSSVLEASSAEQIKVQSSLWKPTFGDKIMQTAVKFIVKAEALLLPKTSNTQKLLSPTTVDTTYSHRLSKRTLMASMVFVIILQIIVVMVVYLVCVTAERRSIASIGCQSGYVSDYLALVVSTVVFLLLIPWSLFCIRKMHDRHYIRRELTASLIVVSASFFFYVGYTCPPVAEHLNSMGISRTFWILLTLLVCFFFSFYMPVLAAARRNKDREETAHYSIEYFETTMKDPHTNIELKKTAAEQFNLDYINFVEEYWEFMASHPTVNRARYLFEKYLALDAPYELELPLPVLRSIRAKATYGILFADLIPAHTAATAIIVKYVFPVLLNKIDK